MSEPLATLSASMPRRVLGAGGLVALGALLAWLALSGEEGVALAWRVLLLGMAALALLAGMRVWQATEHRVELREDGLYESTGRQLVRIADVASVDRGMFAFKPSNGFVLRLVHPAPRGWAPGLWWRMGRRVGIGGVTSSGEARAMADIISVMLARRDGKADLLDRVQDEMRGGR